jgi:hypothetical protein
MLDVAAVLLLRFADVAISTSVMMPCPNAASRAA